MSADFAASVEDRLLDSAGAPAPNTSPTPSAAETAILVRIISLSVCGRRARGGEVSAGARARSACLIRHCDERPLRVVLADAASLPGVNPTDDPGAVTNHDTVTE